MEILEYYGLLKRGSECFESLSMNGQSSILSKPLRSS
jgi:hypothetical protein